MVEKSGKNEKRWSDQLYTLNLTVVALVALVAIVGLTAIVLKGGGRLAPETSSQAAANQAGSASLPGQNGYSNFQARQRGSNGNPVNAQTIIKTLDGCKSLGPVVELQCAKCVKNDFAFNTETRFCVI